MPPLSPSGREFAGLRVENSHEAGAINGTQVATGPRPRGGDAPLCWVPRDHPPAARRDMGRSPEPRLVPSDGVLDRDRHPRGILLPLGQLPALLKEPEIGREHGGTPGTVTARVPS